VKEKIELDRFPTPIEFLLNNCYHDKKYEELTKQAFEFFIKQKVDFLYDKKIIIIGSLEDILKSIDNLN
jgi:hypothetical protein